jgi:hypothetical protein
MILHRPQIVQAIVFVLTLAAIAQLYAAEVPAHGIGIRIDFSSPARILPDNFLGFGYETSAVAQPGYFSGKNKRLIQLYKNLGPHGLIRIGGNVSDHARFVPDGTAAAKTEKETTVINAAGLSDLGDFARATGWRVMWGLNLATGTKDQAVDEAVAVDRALGSTLQSFEIGNEVDLMRKHGKNFDAYHADYARYKAAIRAKLPRAVFSGPDSAGSFSYVENFVAAESSDMALVTHHYYRGGARDPKSTLPRLLARDAAFDARLDQLKNLCSTHHLDYRINEVNSYSGGGKEGVSDTFGSALWCLDYLFELASHGCCGANIETDINQLGFISFYSPIVHDAAGVCSARPEYYGMLAFAMAGRGELLTIHVDENPTDLTAYATRDGQGAVFLTVINKDLKAGATLSCSLPAGLHSAQAFRLQSASPESKTGVRFAGASVADDGTWAAAAGEPVRAEAGMVRFTVPRCSAAVLKFTRG